MVRFALIYDAAATPADVARSGLFQRRVFVEAARPRPWIPRALQALWILALGGVVLGISGPHLSLPVPVRDGSVFICIDTSGSMASADVFPTRSQAAKDAARAFLEESPGGTKIGIISFAGAAGVVAAAQRRPPSSYRCAGREFRFLMARRRSATRSSLQHSNCPRSDIASSS